MKLLIAGYVGCCNLGDEAILESLLAGIRQETSDMEVTVISADPEKTYAAYNVISINKFKYFDILKALWACDAFILGGGGLLQDSTSRQSLSYYLFLIRAAKFFKKKVILLGQGIGPVKGRGKLRRALRGVDLIAVRDEGALHLLAEIGVYARKVALTADMSFLMPSPDRNLGEKILTEDGVKKSQSMLIGVSVRHPVGGSGSAAEFKAIASVCDHLIDKKGAQIVFLIMRDPDDVLMSQAVISHMKNKAHVLLRQGRPGEMLAVISQFDAVIGMRLHSLIFSAIAGVPCFGISYDPKVAEFQRSIKMPFIDFSAIDEARLIRAVDSFVSALNKPSYEVKVLTERAKRNITLLMECLASRKINILGVDIDNYSMDVAISKIEGMLAEKKHSLVVTPNPEIIMASQKDIELKTVINSASLAAADGVGLMIAGRMLGKHFRQRIAGIDLMLKVVEMTRAKASSIFLLGGKEGVAEAAAKKLDANIAGVNQGYFINDSLIVTKIKQARPDILFIGMGSPRQEKWAARHLRELDVPLVMCVGGSLDVISGRVRRAPLFMRMMGIEWLWRLITEPRRWRRMLILPLFILKVIRSRFW